ncbi:MAG: TolC family protein [Bacteroidales bacterium]|jgi:outer membrane protein TolC|nr:TolC family protein [Bacteroidales bacterium]
MRKMMITGLLSLLSTGWVNSQELLTLEKAVSIGLTNNFGIVIAQNSLRTAQNDASPGNAGMLPVISMNAGYVNGLSNAKVNVVTGSELNNSSAHSDLITAGVGLTWTVFDGLKMFITYDKLKKLEEMSELSAKITVENTMARIIGSYYDIIRQGKVHQIYIEQVAISRFRLDLAKMRFETGTGSEMEFLKARVELNADIADLSNQHTLYENSKTTLNDLLSRDVNIPFEVNDTILVSEKLQYDSLRISMKKANRNLLLAIMNKRVAQLELSTTRANQWPTLDLYANYNYYRSETEANFIQYNRNFGPSIGLSFTMKLFDGLNLNRQHKNASISLQTSDIEIKQMENRLEAYLVRIYNDYQNQIQMIGFEKENLLLAEKNMDIARESYAVGAISSLQLREVQEDLLYAGTRLVTAEFKAKLTETELLLLCGKLLN